MTIHYVLLDTRYLLLVHCHLFLTVIATHSVLAVCHFLLDMFPVTIPCLLLATLNSTLPVTRYLSYFIFPSAFYTQKKTPNVCHVSFLLLSLQYVLLFINFTFSSPYKCNECASDS